MDVRAATERGEPKVMMSRIHALISKMMSGRDVGRLSSDPVRGARRLHREKSN